MFNTLGVVFILLFFAVIAATVLLKRMSGTKILVLGKKDKRELLFGAGYLALLYIILSNAFPLPMPEIINRFFWNSGVIRAVGAIFCCLGLLGFIICAIAFWQSVRIGIDYENAGKLTTTGIYAYSRNPMYLSFYLIFFGEFLLFPNIGLLASLIVAFVAFSLTIRKEEKFLISHYGKEYEDYRKKVRRYI